jgi:TonB family protein
MAEEAQKPPWSGPSRRRVERFDLKTPLDVTVLRSGVPDAVPGRTVDASEGGLAAMLAGELTPGEIVGIEVQLPVLSDPLRARAKVTYQDQLRCGFEFVGLSARQRQAVRDCANGARAGVTAGPQPVGSGPAGGPKDQEKDLVKTERDKPAAKAGRGGATGGDGGSGGKSGNARRRAGWIVLLIAIVIVIAIAAALFWWRWNRAWEELESGLKSEQPAPVERPEAQVPAEVMQKLLIHRVEPVYPPEARRANLQGVIALDIVVGRDGSVANMRALNGPDVLARAAMDALRWWRFEPYRVNGEPAVVETTVAVEFKR